MTNPYSPPKSRQNQCARYSHAVGFLVSSWIAWILLTVSLGWSLVAVVKSNVSFGGEILGGLSWHVAIVGAQVLMVLAIRWIFLRFMLRSTAMGSRQEAFGYLIGTALLYGMVKVIEFEGFQLWRESGILTQFLVFALPSYFLTLILMPPRLFAYCNESFARQQKHPAKEGAEQLAR